MAVLDYAGLRRYDGKIKQYTGDLVDTVVEVTDTQPVDLYNKVWVSPSEEEFELAEMSDVEELKSAIKNTDAKALIDVLPVSIYSGGLKTYNGTPDTNNKRLSIRDVLPLNWNVQVTNGLITSVFYYREDYTYIGNVTVAAEYADLSKLALSGAAYANVVFRNKDDTAVQVGDLDITVWKEFSNSVYYPLTIGTLKTATGVEDTSTTRARTGFIKTVDCIINVDSEAHILVYGYSTNDASGYTGLITESFQTGKVQIKKTDAEYIRIMCEFINNRTLSNTSSHWYKIHALLESCIASKASDEISLIYFVEGNQKDSMTIQFDLNSYDYINAYIRSDGKIVSDQDAKSVLIPCEGVSEINVQTQSEIGGHIAFLTSNIWTSGTKPSYATGYSNAINISANKTVSVIAPSDTRYLYVEMLTSTATDVTPTFVKAVTTAVYLIKREDTVQSDSTPAYVNNALKKANQIDNITWTAKGNVYKQDGTSYLVTTGNTLKGIPYSSVKEYDKYVPFNVSFRTFMTAVNNPYSLLYTENVNGSYSQSDYGITYHGSNCGCYFGAVCSALVSYALGFEEAWTSGDMPKQMVKRGIMEVVPDQSANGVLVCDVISESGHVALVYNVEHDDSGEIKSITTIETKSTVPVLVKYTPSQFNSSLVQDNKTILRYNKLYRNSKYIPCEFVAVGDEPVQEYVYNNDVCTFAGDYAAFRTGEEIWINYNLGETQYTGISVKNKSGTEVFSDTLPSGHKITIGSALPAGLYTAELTADETSSDPTHFEIIDTTVSVTSNNNMFDIEFSSMNGSPVYIKTCDISGSSKGVRLLTDEEKLSGKCSINPSEMFTTQYGGSLSGDVYVKVFFKGRYGIVTNEIIQLDY